MQYYDNIPFKTDIYETTIKAHSKNIIDLIEVGDYVYGDEITDIIHDPFINGQINLWTERNVVDNLGDVSILKYTAEDIKTILTHEQYEQNCYKESDIE